MIIAFLDSDILPSGSAPTIGDSTTQNTGAADKGANGEGDGYLGGLKNLKR